MTENKNLTTGPILRQILALALPVIASSFLHMTYNLTDVFWVGRLSADDIAAVSGIGYIIWFGVSLGLIAKIGAEVCLSQSIGKGKPYRIERFARSAIQLTVVLSVVYSIFCIIYPKLIIESVFSFNSDYVTNTATDYLQISSIGFVFMFLNPVFNGIMNGLGDTKTPFRLIAAGIISNIILDPILIFGIGPIPAMGAPGAALASVIASTISFALFARALLKSGCIATSKIFSFAGTMPYKKSIFKIGAPVALQITLFSVFAMLITRIVTNWGDIPVAVISIGANIEALSWMTAGGISTALSTFVGQNYGAKKYGRIAKGYSASLVLGTIWGSIITVLLFFYGGDIIGAFNSDQTLVTIGWEYMHIVAVSQIFMCIEIATTGALSGIGKTMPSAIVSIGFNGLRVVGAYILAYHTPLALNGVWWSISISSLFKGTALVVWFTILLKSYFTPEEFRGKVKFYAQTHLKIYATRTFE